MDSVVNVGIRITRRCSMNCMYCNINAQKRTELSVEQWKKALEISKKLGANKVTILGGEPTMYNGISEIISYVTKELKLSCSVTTNAYNNYEKILEMLDAGLTKLGVSIDTYNFKESISPLKCREGLNLLDKLLIDRPNANITNYTVINKKNVKYVIDLISNMNSRKVHTYILPFHWGNEGSFEHRRNNEQFAFIEDSDILYYNEIIDKIIDMKKNGFLIDNSIEFLKNTGKHIKKLNWKCEGLSELRIDSDGMMCCCCDKFGSVNEKFSIFDLENDEKYKEFVQMRKNDELECLGCLWPSAFEAEFEKNNIL